MNTYSTSEARTALAELIDRVAHGGERIVLTRRGLPVVALVPVDEAEAMEALEDEHDARAIDEARAEGGELLSYEEVLRNNGFDPQEIRHAAALLLEEDARRLRGGHKLVSGS